MPRSTQPSGLSFRTRRGTPAADPLKGPGRGAGLSVPAIVFGLAGDAAGRVGTRVEPAFGYLEPAVDAPPVRVLLDAAQRGEYLVSLAAG